MNDKKQELIEQAKAIYLKFGIKSVTMDEMARQLGVSKKTLYSFVKDKNELVELCVLSEHEGEICKIGEINQTYQNAIDEILAISKYVAGTLKKLHPSIFFDLAKYHPNALKIINNHKREFVRGCVIDNLQKGIEQGYYRSNIKIEILSTLYLALMDHIMLGDLFPDTEISLDAIYEEFFRYHLKGIASQKGLEYLNQLTQNNENF